MDEHWLSEDPFSDSDDPEAAARERRRQEREARRRQKSGSDKGAPQPDPMPPPRPQPPRERETPAGEQHAGESRRPVATADWEASEPDAGSVQRPGIEWRTPTKSSGRGPGRGVRRGAAIALALIAGLSLWLVWALAQPFHGDGNGRVNVQVPEGASVGEVADLLADRGVIANPTLFQVRVTLAGKRSEIYPGTYTLAEDMSYGDAIDSLSTIPVERTVTVTIPEGYSREQVAEVVAEAGLPGDYMRASQRSNQLNPARFGGANARSLEGFLFPATYELPADAGAGALVNLQLQAFKDRLSGIPMRYARSRNLTVYDVVTIASMIEREVSAPKERRLAASVIYNRLSEGIPLGIDATTRYAVGNFTEPLTQSQLESDSPYNTRNRQGLPPGPIGNPGEESLRAAARPANTDYLYYVVEPGTCGLHAFSSDYAQFERDVAAYHQAREEAGGQSPTDCG